MTTKLHLKLFLFVIAMGFGTLNAFAQSKAVAYLDKIGKELDAVQADTWDYISTVAHSKSGRKIESRRKELVRTTKLATQHVSVMKDFEGNTGYRDSVVSFLKLSYLILNDDYEKILNLEEIAEQSYDAMEAYMTAQELANDKLDLASDRLIDEQKKFAESNGITLLQSKDKTDKKMASSGKVLKYYHQIYLIFFKPNKEEAYLIDAQNKNDINAMEQHKNTLVKFANEAKEKLVNVKSFNGDGTLKSTCNEAMEFYIKEAEKMKVVVDYYIKKESFEKMKTAFDAKAESSRTKADIDAFNKNLKEFNDSVNNFNKVNNELNNTRSTIIDKWNKQMHGFLDRHIPKKK